MSWGAVVGAGVGLLGSAMSSDKNGGAGTTSQSKEPWAPAQPWLLSNIVQGQNLQNQYAAQPFSPQQQAAYDNSYAQSDYMRNLIPSLLGQMSQQQVGFDPSNPTAKPAAWNWQGLLGDGAPNLNQTSVLDAKPAAAPATAPAQQSGDFVQQGYGDPVIEQQMKQYGNLGGNQLFIDPSQYTGKYGSFKYGDPMPQAGTQAYKDLSDYLAYGGADPMNLYGKGPQSTQPERSGGA